MADINGPDLSPRTPAEVMDALLVKYVNLYNTIRVKNGKIINKNTKLGESNERLNNKNQKLEKANKHLKMNFEDMKRNPTIINPKKMFEDLDKQIDPKKMTKGGKSFEQIKEESLLARLNAKHAPKEKVEFEPKLTDLENPHNKISLEDIEETVNDKSDVEINFVELQNRIKELEESNKRLIDDRSATGQNYSDVINMLHKQINDLGGNVGTIQWDERKRLEENDNIINEYKIKLCKLEDQGVSYSEELNNIREDNRLLHTHNNDLRDVIAIFKKDKQV